MKIDNTQTFSDKALADFKLIDQAIEGNEKAYAELMNRHWKSVHYALLKMVKNDEDAQDLTIEAFTKAFKSLPNFKKDFPFYTWLFNIARNGCVDFIRKNKIETISIGIDDTICVENGDTVIFEIKDDKLNPQEETIKNQKIAVIRVMDKLLPRKYQKLVNMRYFEEFSHKEIAERLEVSMGTVKVQLRRARELLYDLAGDKEYI